MVARVVFFSLVLLVVGSAAGAVTVINNGLAPPNPANVVPYFNHNGEHFYVQNVGCDATVAVPCVSPGAATEVALLGYMYVAEVRETSTLELEGGYGANATAYDQSTVRIKNSWSSAQLHMRDQSTLEYSGTGESALYLHDQAELVATAGYIQSLDLRDATSAVFYGGGCEYCDFLTTGSVVIHDGRFSFGLELVGASTALSILGGSFGHFYGPMWIQDTATVSVFDGSFEDLFLEVSDSASVSFYGGDIDRGSIEAHDSARVTIHGHGFTVDGLPVGYGPLSPSGGLLAGTLQSGGVMSPIPFSLFGGGQIVLVPEPSTALLVGLGLAALAVRRRQSG